MLATTRQTIQSLPRTLIDASKHLALLTLSGLLLAPQSLFDGALGGSYTASGAQRKRDGSASCRQGNRASETLPVGGAESRGLLFLVHWRREFGSHCR